MSRGEIIRRLRETLATLEEDTQDQIARSRKDRDNPAFYYGVCCGLDLATESLRCLLEVVDREESNN